MTQGLHIPLDKCTLENKYININWGNVTGLLIVNRVKGVNLSTRFALSAAADLIF